MHYIVDTWIQHYDESPQSRKGLVFKEHGLVKGGGMVFCSCAHTWVGHHMLSLVFQPVHVVKFDRLLVLASSVVCLAHRGL